jgi:proteasome lid subunit RPN8/RPN11
MIQPFEPSVVAAIREHALNEFPKECCGLVIGRELGASTAKYVPSINLSENPEHAFEIDAKVIVRALESKMLLGIVHSHTHGQDWPSLLDQRQSILYGLPFGICMTDGKTAQEPFWFGKGTPMEPLLKRTFREYAQDCYTLIQDCYRLGRAGMAAQGFPDWPHEQIELPYFEREHGWHAQGKNLYVENFPKAGFRVMQQGQDEHRISDLFLCKAGSRVTIHGGVLVTRDLVLHHLRNRYSTTDPSSRWGAWNHVDYWLRYEGPGAAWGIS